MKSLRPFFLVALLFALVPAVWAAPPEAPPEASLWGDIFDAVVHVLESVVESVLPEPEATASESSGNEEDPVPELWPTVEPVG